MTMKKILIAALLLLTSALPSLADGECPRGLCTTRLNITTATVIKAAPGTMIAFTVNVAGAAGTINDTTTTGGVAAGNQMAPIPAVVGVYYIPMPFLNGLVVAPGAAQVVSITYQ
jgi:hypothetical protein